MVRTIKHTRRLLSFLSNYLVLQSASKWEGSLYYTVVNCLVRMAGLYYFTRSYNLFLEETSAAVIYFKELKLEVNK